MDQFVEQADESTAPPEKARYKTRNLHGKMQQVTLTFDPADLDKIDEAADFESRSRAQFVRLSVMAAAREVLKKKKND